MGEGENGVREWWRTEGRSRDGRATEDGRLHLHGKSVAEGVGQKRGLLRKKPLVPPGAGDARSGRNLEVVLSGLTWGWVTKSLASVG